MKVVSVLALLSTVAIASAGPVNVDDETAEQLPRSAADNTEALARTFKEAFVDIVKLVDNALAEGGDDGLKSFREALVKAIEVDGAVSRDGSWKDKAKKWLEYINKFAKGASHVAGAIKDFIGNDKIAQDVGGESTDID